MPATPIFVFNGSVVVPNFYLDYQTMRIHSAQQHTDVTYYGGTVFGQDLGSGTEKMDFACTGFPFKGVTNAGSPFMGQMNGTSGALGGASTFTIDTSCTISCSATGVDGSMNHSRIVAGAMCSLEFVLTEDATIAWST
jgi:hypothetical protein